MKILDKLEPFYKGWVHPKIQSDPVADHLVRIMMIAIAFLIPGMIFLLWLFVEIGFTYGIYSQLFFLPSLVLLLFCFRYFPNFNFLYNFSILANFINIIILVLGDGGLTSIYNSLFIIVIWWSFYLGRKRGLIWTAATLLVAGGILVLQLNDIWVVESLPETYRSLFLSILMIYFLVYCGLIFGASKFNELRLVRKLDNSRKLLERNEKMASLGQLTAGIAHEINNPINFINGSAEALELDFQDLQIVLDKLILLEKNQDDKIKNELISDLRGMDLATLRKEMKSMIQNLKNGSERVTEIVKGMESYTYQSSNTFEKRQANAILNDALVILSNKLKEKEIEVVKNYNLTKEVSCLPGKLNQVFVNIIDNAIGASSVSGKLEITTDIESGGALIQFKDNGTGMEGNIQRKIFDPFFTTKSIGQGTGLGMSISYGIIKDHNGTIHIDSTPDVGTTIRILLPLEE